MKQTGRNGGQVKEVRAQLRDISCRLRYPGWRGQARTGAHLGVGNLSLFGDDLLVEHFHGEELVCLVSVALLHQEDLTECPFSHHLPIGPVPAPN